MLNLGYPDEEQRAQLIQRWLDDYNFPNKLNVKKMAVLTSDRSSAQIKELVISTAKRSVTSGNPVTMDDFIELLIQQLTDNSNGKGVAEAAVILNSKGASIRSLAKAIGVPHNTLLYQINKLTKGDDSTDE